MLSMIMAIQNDNDREKAAEIYRQYGSTMLYIAKSILNDAHLAEDAVSEAFVRIINNLEKIDTNDCYHTRGFVVIITRNVSLDIIRKQNRGRTINIDDFSDYSKCEDPVFDDITTREACSVIKNAISKLNSNYSDILYLKMEYDYSNKEISKILNISEENVKMRLSRARKALKEQLLEENNAVTSCFVSKNLAGEYFTGTLYSSKNTSSEKIKETLMTSAWKQRNLHYYTKDISKIKSDLFSASATNGDLFTVNYNWKTLTPWHQNSWQSGTSYLSEWMCFKGVRADDGYDYYAWCVESYITPINGGTDYVKLSSNAAYQPSGQLRFYDPKSTPATNTVSFTIGGGITKNGVGLNISASYSTQISDLTIINNSNMGINLAKINFDYNYLSSFAHQETLNCFSVIEKNTTNSSTFKFHHRREAKVIGNHINYLWDQNYYTTLNRPSA